MTRAAAAVLLVFVAVTSHATVSLDDYHLMQKGHFAVAATPLAAEISLARDVATWRLESGGVQLMQPLADGSVTGLVFEGRGRFVMTVPDPVELSQLRRFTEHEDLTGIDVPFTRLVLRTSDRSLAARFPATPGPAEENALARKRHDLWLEEFKNDVDARVVGGLVTPGEVYLRVDVDTEAFGWLTFEYDGQRPEEITLQKFQFGYVEQWLSLDRAEDRLPNGRPSTTRRDTIDLDHIRVRADLRKSGDYTLGKLRVRTIDAQFEVEEVCRALVDGPGVAYFDLDPTAKLTKVTEDGQALAFIRDHIGGRSRMIDNRIYDESITVLLNRPLRAGETRRFVFTYSLEMPHYAAGNGWYPTVSETLLDPHTAMLELTAKKKAVVRAMGARQSLDTTDDAQRSVWAIARPAKMVTFAVGDDFKEISFEQDGLPRVVVFGREGGLTSGDMVKNVGVDVVNALAFYQWLFDTKIESEELFVTAIAGVHGQAFDGFLHLAESTFNQEHPGASELFRGHEVAHQWWGHAVGWTSYRDQWLSEAFSEYAAIMFVESTMKDGPKQVNEILRSYSDMINGSLQTSRSKFSRPWLIELNKAHRARLGPIDVGYRAGTRDVPAAYVLQTYHKGAFVVHMLRMIARNFTGNDDRFVAILRDFVRTHRGRTASTADLQAVVEKQLGGDWDWFFDAWVRGADIPTYSWSYQPGDANADGTFNVTFRIRRSGTAPGFTMVVPARVELADGRIAMLPMMVRTDDETFTRKLPAAPKSVTFNPDHSVLAKIRKE